jgi:hypothetical protein
MMDTARNTGLLPVAGELLADRAHATTQLPGGFGFGTLAMLFVSLTAPVWFALLVGRSVTSHPQPIPVNALRYA